MSQNGDIRREGSTADSTIGDGTVRKNGSIIGSVERGSRAQVAAYFLSFILDE